MRLPRPLLIALLPVALAGCLHRADRAGSADVAPFLSAEPPPDAAFVGYVLVERTAGGEEINRRVWDRIDEQVFPFEVQTVLENAGLRVGVAGESAPGLLRRLIDDPRTDRGHRARLFALDKPAPLAVSDVWPRAEFKVPASDGVAARFGRDAVALGFDLTVRDAADGKVLVRFVPHARYREPNRLLPGADGIRDEAAEAFSGAAFELPLGPGEFLVIGTDWYWEGTFGHFAFTGEKDDRTVQRLLVLWAGRTRDEGEAASPAGSAPPLAAQAATARGSRP